MYLNSFVTYVLDLYIDAALGMFYSIARQHQFGCYCRQPVYSSPVVDEALLDLSHSNISNSGFV